MSRINRLGLFLLLVGGSISVAAKIALAAPVVCPAGEPDFVYQDVGNDGCFNSGLDTQIPDSLLLGTYSAPVGTSIVVPVGVKVAPDTGVALDWTARSIFVRGNVTTDDASFTARGDALGRHELVGSVSAKGSGSVTLTCTAQCNGSIIGSGAKLSAGGAINIPVSAVIEDDVSILSKEGNVSLRFSTIGADFSVEAAQALSLTTDPPASVGIGASFVAGTAISSSALSSPSFVAAADLTMVGGSISISGAGPITIGDDSKLISTAGSCNLSNGATRSFGAGVAIVSSDSISISGSDSCTAGDGITVVAPNSISFSGGVAQSFGADAKLSTDGSLVVSGGGGDIVFGLGAKLSASSIGISNGAQRIIGDDAKISASSAVTVSGGGPSVVGSGVKIKAATITFAGGSTATFGDGISFEAKMGLLNIGSFATTLAIGSGGKLKGVGVSISSSGDRTIGLGTSIDATTGTLSIGSSGATSIDAGAKLRGAVVGFGNSGNLSLGADSSVTASTGAITISNGGTTSVGDGTKVKAEGAVNLTNSNSRVLGMGVSIVSKTGSVTLQGGLATTIGDGFKLAGASASIGGSTITLGDKVSLKTVGPVAFASPGAQTFGDKLKLKAEGSLAFSSGGNVILGAKPLVSAASIGLSIGGVLQLGDKAKLKTLAAINLAALSGVNFGLGAKVTAGSDIAASANGPAASLLMSSAKMKSGTEKEDMDPASTITLQGFDISVTDSVLSGADAIHEIRINPQETMVVDNSKLSAKTIIIGSTLNAPFTTFSYTQDATKGSDDPSTITFQAAATTCTLTGSSFKNITVDTSSCATVVGP